MSESPGPGGSSPADERVSIQVRSLLVSGRQLSWPLFAQLPETSPTDYPRKRILGEILGTVGCPPPPTSPPFGQTWSGRCPLSAHHHVLWQREDDGQLCCWTVTEARLQALAPRARSLWWKHGQHLSDLLALQLSGKARSERLSGNRVRLGGYVLGLSAQVLLLVRQLDWMRQTHDEDLARLRQQCLFAEQAGTDAGGEVGGTMAWRMLAALHAAGVLLDRLALRGIGLSHPLRWGGGWGGRAWLLTADGDCAAVVVDSGPRRAFPAEPGLYLCCPESDVPEICQQVADHFPALRVLLAKGAISHQMARIAQDAREKADLLARGGAIGAALLAPYCEPIAEVTLPPEEVLHACYQSEREQHLAWVERLESLVVRVHTLPRFMLLPLTEGADAPLPPSSPLPQAPGEHPPEVPLQPGSVPIRGQEGVRSEMEGRGIPLFSPPPGWQETGDGLAPDLEEHIAQLPGVQYGVPAWTQGILNAREREGVFHIPPLTGGTPVPPPTLDEGARAAIDRAGILHQYEPYPLDRLKTIVLDPFLLELLGSVGAVAPLYFACLRGRPDPGLLALLGMLLLFLYGGLALFDGLSNWQCVVRVRLRPTRSGRFARPVGARPAVHSGRLPLSWEVRWHLFGITYTSAFLLIWVYALMRAFITFEQSMGLTLLLFFVPLWLCHMLRGGYLALARPRRLRRRRRRRGR